MNKDIEIIGIRIHQLNLKEAVSQIENFIRSGDKHQVSVINVYSVVMMQKDEEFKKINNSSSLVVADGMPLVWLCHLKGQRDVTRVYGPDLMLSMCERSVGAGYRHFFYGGAANAAESPTATLVRREMQSWRLLQLEPSSLRAPDQFTAPTKLGIDGAHLAATLFQIYEPGFVATIIIITSQL